MKYRNLTQCITYLLTTCLGLGLFPYAPGTCTSFVAGLLFFALGQQELWVVGLVILSLFFVGVYAAHYVAIDQKKSDPKIVVIDEWVGIWLAFFVFRCCTVFGLLPGFVFSSWSFYILLFLLFRFFDIVKPCGIKKIENISGGWGIMLDDVLAALYAVITLWLVTILL